MEVNYPMNNQEMIQKLMLGADDKQDIEIEVNDVKATFTMRPLTAGELSSLQTIEKKGFHMTIGMQGGKRQTVSTNMNDLDVNVGEFSEYQSEAMYTAISLSLDLKVEDIKKLPTGVPEALFEKVIEISKLSDDDLTVIKTFRQKK